MSDSVSRPSRAPEAPPKKPASRQVTRAAQRRVSSQATRCAALVAGCTATVSDGAKAFYRAALTDQAAAEHGRRFSPRKVVAEWITVATTLAPWIQRGRVAGYGPARFRYAAEIAHEVAAQLQEPDASATGTAPTEATPPSAAAPVDLAALKRAVAQGLRNLGVEAKGSTPTNASANTVSHTLEELALAVQRAAASVPADVMADAGLTPAVIDALANAAQHALSTHATVVATRTEALSLARREDVLVGRLLREMRLMLASARTARKANHEVPSPRSALLSTAKPRAKKEPAPPAPPPAPAPH
jgi:hypothetical protein